MKEYNQRGHSKNYMCFLQFNTVNILIFTVILFFAIFEVTLHKYEPTQDWKTQKHFRYETLC